MNRTTFNWKGMRITSSDPTADSRTFTVNPEIAANFCNAHCPRGISEIMTGSFPRSRLLARHSFRVDHANDSVFLPGEGEGGCPALLSRKIVPRTATCQQRAFCDQVNYSLWPSLDANANQR